MTIWEKNFFHEDRDSSQWWFHLGLLPKREDLRACLIIPEGALAERGMAASKALRRNGDRAQGSGEGWPLRGAGTCLPEEQLQVD